MKKIFKYSYIALLALMTFAFSACTDDYDYDAVKTVNNDGAYILANKTTYYWSDTDAQTMNVIIARHDTTEAKTYKLVTSDSKVSVPAEVSFAANEKTKLVPVTCNFNVGDLNKRVVIGIADEDAYTYGAHSQTYTFNRCKTFEGTFVSTVMGDESGNAAQWPVKVYECGVSKDQGTAQYLIEDVYGAGLNVMFTLNSKGKATTDSQPAWTHPNYGYIYVSGNGTYDSSNNYIKFLWAHDVPGLGSFGTFVESLYFPDGYNPITQTQE